MTGFWSQGIIWKGCILSPIIWNHRALMKDAALYQLLCTVPLISVWRKKKKKKKNLLILSREDMRAEFIRYYNGTPTQICGFSWEEVQSHLAWRMPLHMAHIPLSRSLARSLSQSRALARLALGLPHHPHPDPHPPSTPTPRRVGTPVSLSLSLWILNVSRRCKELAPWKSNRATERSVMQTRAALQRTNQGGVCVMKHWCHYCEYNYYITWHPRSFHYTHKHLHIMFFIFYIWHFSIDRYFFLKQPVILKQFLLHAFMHPDVVSQLQEDVAPSSLQ